VGNSAVFHGKQQILQQTLCCWFGLIVFCICSMTRCLDWCFQASGLLTTWTESFSRRERLVSTHICRYAAYKQRLSVPCLCS